MRKIEELFKLKEPYFHLAVGEKSDFQKLSATCENAGDGNAIIKTIEGNKCNTLDELFSEFAKIFKFPDYFGHNWAAFDECINDLNWLSSDAYLLLMPDIDKVLISSETSFKIFIKTLVFSVREWAQGRTYDDFPIPSTPFHILFQCSKEKENDVRIKLEQSGLVVIDTIILPI